MHQIREMNHIGKNKPIFKVRISQETLCPSNLRKQKAEPTLKLFGPKLSSGLRDEFTERAKGTYHFLKLMHDYVIQPLLIRNSYKHKHDLKAMMFKEVNDVRLKHMTEIAD